MCSIFQVTKRSSLDLWLPISPDTDSTFKGKNTFALVSRTVKDGEVVCVAPEGYSSNGI